MEFTWKKILGICLFFMAVVVGPIVLLSNPMMDYYQKKIDKNPNTDFSKWLLLTSANVCYKTNRPERAADYYRKYMELHPKDEKRAFTMLRYANCLDDCNRNQDAIEMYIKYMEEYPNREDVDEAKKGIDRCKYMKPK
jgi:tetratricopeptide (TPR) repeat protein